MKRILTLSCALVVAGGLLAGCGGDSTSDTAVPGLSPGVVPPSGTPTALPSGAASDPGLPGPDDPTALPTMSRPTAPPRNPTDQTKKTDLVVGTVTRGGTGPCYGLSTDDGTEYALYDTSGQELVKGTRISVRATPSRLRIDCGPGKLVEITEVTTAG